MKNSSRGQASIILILIIAMGFIFYAIVLNWGKLAQYKNMTTVAANLSAAQMGSQAASYGQLQWKETLNGAVNDEGEPEIEESTGFMYRVIIMALVIAIAVIATVFGQMYVWVLVIIIIANVAVVVMDVVIVQPGLTSMWNKLQKNLPAESRFLEQGLTTGLQNVVSDHKDIPDYFDLNGNGLFGVKNSIARDNISRYGFFYTERLRALQPPVLNGIKLFVSGLKVFVDGDGSSADNQWRLSVPLCADAAMKNDPHCNPCCIPLQQRVYYGYRWGAVARMVKADDGSMVECSTDAVPSACRESPTGPGILHDSNYEDYRLPAAQLPASYLARFGHDLQYPGDITYLRSRIASSSFRQEMANFVSSNKMTGIFPLFWGWEALKQDPNAQPNPGGITNGSSYDNRMSDAVGTNFQFPPAANFIKPLEQCVEKTDDFTKGFFWKQGDEQMCVGAPPPNNPINGNDPNTMARGEWYSPSNCDRHQCSGNKTCACAVSTLDPVDDFAMKMHEFAAWARTIEKLKPAELQSTLNNWYPQAALWGAPQCRSCSDFDDMSCDSNKACNPNQEGALRRWFSQNENGQAQGILLEWQKLLKTWLDKDYADDSAWCVPRSVPADMGMGERSTLGAFPGGFINGSLTNVKNCLSWNTYNSSKFQSYYQDCHDNYCTALVSGLDECANLPAQQQDGCKENLKTLPRSLLPNFHPNTELALLLAKPIPDMVKTLQLCRNTGIAANCAKSAGYLNMPFDGANWGNERKNPFYLALQNKIADQCHGTPCDEDFLNKIDLSRTLAIPQGPKFAERKILLDQTQQKAEEAFALLGDAEYQMCLYLRNPGESCEQCRFARNPGPDCPAEGTNANAKLIDRGGPMYQLMKAKRDQVQQQVGLPNFIIYGWRSDPPKGSKRTKGYWHLVKVRAYSPGRGANAKAVNSALPSVQTDTRFGLNFDWENFVFGIFVDEFRKYFLDKKEGNVIAVVNRWDQDHNETNGSLSFANGFKIWDVRYGKPGNSVAPTDVDTLLQTTCGGIGILQETRCSLQTEVSKQIGSNNLGPIKNHPSFQAIMKDAFMLNKIPKVGKEWKLNPLVTTDERGTNECNVKPDPAARLNEEAACRELANKLLNSGIESSACVHYYFDKKNVRMAMKYVDSKDCKSWIPPEE